MPSKKFYRRQARRVALTIIAMLTAAILTAAPALAKAAPWMWG